MEKTIFYFEYVTKIILWLLAALIPFWFTPLPVGVEFGRELVFTPLIIIAFILWLLTVLMRGEVVHRNSVAIFGGILLLAVFGLSVVFSLSPLLSFSLTDTVGEKFSTLLLAVILMVLCANSFRSREEVGNFVFLLIFSGSLSGLIVALQIWFGVPLYQYISSSAGSVDFNVIGTVNGFSLFCVALLGISLGFVFSPYFHEWKKWVRYSLYASIFIFLINLLLINFRMSWVILLVTSVFLFGFTLKSVRAEGGRFNLRSLLIVLFLVFNLVMVGARVQVFRNVNLPAEISPSLATTLGISLAVFKEGVKSFLLGSGPGTFGLDWGLYKSPAVNSTVFWNVRFNQGFSWASTILPTVGLLGLLSFLLFVVLSFVAFLRSILFLKEGQGILSMSVFLGFSAMILASFLYPATFSFILLLFILGGLLSFLLSRDKLPLAVFPPAPSDFSEEVLHSNASPSRPWSNWNSKGVRDTFRYLFGVDEYILKFEAPWVVFISSLVVIFLLSLSVMALYFDIGHIHASLVRTSALRAFEKGDRDGVIAKFERVIRLEPKNYRNYQNLVLVKIERAKELINKASNGQNVQQEFQLVINSAIQDSQRSIQLHPRESLVWKTQGSLYELIIPYIQGAERLAFASYTRAAELDPVNPAAWMDVARPGLVFADRTLLLMGQANAQDREQLNQSRVSSLLEVEKALQKAIGVKQDFAGAHFLLAQTALRLGNVKGAIDSVEKARAAAPFDIGIAFQLGLLYYQNGDFNRAGGEFLRAISLNENYSNARYFLGLIYDRNGNKAGAIFEFEKVQSLNPDNQEVKKILENLRSGRGALDAIVPPAEAPEKRKETPVKEDTTGRKK